MVSAMGLKECRVPEGAEILGGAEDGLELFEGGWAMDACGGVGEVSGPVILIHRETSDLLEGLRQNNLTKF